MKVQLQAALLTAAISFSNVQIASGMSAYQPTPAMAKVTNTESGNAGFLGLKVKMPSIKSLAYTVAGLTTFAGTVAFTDLAQAAQLGMQQHGVSIAEILGVTEETTYKLGSHPDGKAAEPFYGLRLDAINKKKATTFDFNHENSNVFMTYDPTNKRIEIFGQVWGGKVNTKKDKYVNPELWDLQYTYEGVTTAMKKGIEYLTVDKNSGKGFGTISNATEEYTLMAKAKKDNFFNLRLNEERGPNYAATGEGWHKVFDANGKKLNGGPNDFLFIVEKKVTTPDPSTVLGILSATGLVVVSKRKK